MHISVPSFLTAMLVLLLASNLQAKPLRNPSTGGANGNLHDMSSTNLTNPVHAVNETQVCVFCHTPHGASAASTLWNRKDPASMGSFPLYGDPPTGGTADLAIQNDPAAQGASDYGVDYPNGASRMCLSCHDGVTAVGDVLVGDPIATNVNTLSDVTADQKIVDLATSHPISFKYTAAAITAINAYHAAKNGGTGDGKSYFLADASLTPLDSLQRVQCTTCHDPHNDTRQTGYNLPFWRNSGSGVENTDYLGTCNNCHGEDPWSPPPAHSM